MFSYLKPISLILMLTLILACEKGAEFSYQHENIHAVTSHQTSDFDRNTAILVGRVNTLNKSGLNEVGFEYGTSDRPEGMLLSIHRQDLQDTGFFTIEVAGLTPSTRYYYRAYATNGKGTAYGEIRSFSTLRGTGALLTTGEAVAITRSSATVSATVTDNGGYNLIRKGICYSHITSTPTVNNTFVDVQSEGNSFKGVLSDLQAGTRYYVRAYAVTSMGTAYGDVITITTSPAILATDLSTAAPTNITASSMVLAGQVLKDNNSAITVRGFCYSSTNSVPTVTNGMVSQAGAGTGHFSSTLTSLVANTTYYVRSFATNSAGSAYGNVVIVKTGLPNLPSSIMVNSISSITMTSAVCNSFVGNAGGGNITARGICFSSNTTQPTVTNADVATSGSGTGAFSTSMSGLDPGATYYVRTYATNEAGTSYSSVFTFRTSSPNLPSGITAYMASGVTLTSASISGFVSNAGGGVIQQRGIVISSTTSTPTIANSEVYSAGTGTGSFQVHVDRLNANTAYFYRAYATNESGTSYSATQRLSTLSASPPRGVTTISARASTTTATLRGSVSADGGATISSRGFVYSTTTASPTIGNGIRAQVGTGIGTFETTISGLSRNTIYYVRSYATNISGTSYGTILTMRTL